MENNGRTFYYQIDLWISNRGTYCRGLYGRESRLRALSALLTVQVSPIYANISEYAYMSLWTPLGDGNREGRDGGVGRARKQNFVLFGDTISCKFAFYCLDLLDREWSILNYKHRWIEVACLLRETDYLDGTMAPSSLPEIFEFSQWGGHRDGLRWFFTLEPIMIVTFFFAS